MEGKGQKRRLTLSLLGSLIGLVFIITAWWWATPNNFQRLQTPTAAVIVIVTPTPTLTIVALPTARIATPTPFIPTPTSTPVVKPELNSTATAQAAQRATAQAEESAQALAQLQTLLAGRPTPKPPRAAFHSRESRLVLAQYFAWFDGDGWNDCNISAGDQPLEAYSSDDPATIARHIEVARDAGLDGFLLHWFGPGDRTDRNFETLLTRSQWRDFTSTIVFSYHIWHAAPTLTQQNIAEAIRYVMDRYSGQPNFLYLEGKPVLFFIDVYRTPRAAGQTPQQFWAAVRDEVDPERQAWWIAEGLDPSYLAVFDGLFVFKITHADYPNDYLKASRWAERVQQWEQQTGQAKLWLATISPGWDDLRAGCRADVRVPNTPHRREREDGALYQATLEAALKSNPDWLLLSSFNEWVEGTYIEPSVQYGDKYLKLTEEFVNIFKNK
ncbi:MAG TPA: glycoside hydrolase family 99-like domain-containing protein [Anaerolineae bacterium]|nr:glycoside hydrolase family 99-like domain-containing protein [Anaerolineae bacterium]